MPNFLITTEGALSVTKTYPLGRELRDPSPIFPFVHLISSIRWEAVTSESQKTPRVIFNRIDYENLLSRRMIS